jgi:prepilin-type processing-associated H-X9-DG protein
MGKAAARLPGGHVEGFADTFAAHFISIYDDVIAGRPAGKPAYPTFVDGHVEMLLGDAIAESARTGGWVDVAGKSSSASSAS